jgi:hypothetical protein
MGEQFYINRLKGNRDRNFQTYEKHINDAINEYINKGGDEYFVEATNLINNTKVTKEEFQIKKDSFEAALKKLETETDGGRRREMNLKDIKEICKANQIKLSRVVDGKRVAYKKKELMTKLKRKKLL